MVIAYQLIMLIIITISFIFVIGSKGDREIAGNATILCTASIVAFIASVTLL